MPCTTVQKITGAIIIRISAMKASPSGFIATPVFGKECPSAMPTAMAISTWMYSTLYQGRCFDAATAVVTVLDMGWPLTRFLWSQLSSLAQARKNCRSSL